MQPTREISIQKPVKFDFACDEHQQQLKYPPGYDDVIE